jgi:nicotinamidase-related amidase
MQFLTKTKLDKKLPLWCDYLKVQQNTRIQLTKPALLVIDMQTDALTEEGQYPVWGGPAIIPRIARLIKAFRSRDLPVIYTQYMLLEPCGCQQNYNLPKAPQLLREGNQGAEIHSDLLLQDSSYVVAQSRYTAFYDTPLDTILRLHDIKDVVITGVESNTCCEATAHDAVFKRYQATFAIDGTGGTDESFHLASLRNFHRAYGRLATVDQIEAGVFEDYRVQLNVA